MRSPVTSVDAAGWAHFGHVKMPDYRWGIFLAPAEADRKVNFGVHRGEPAWQEVPGEYRANLRRLERYLTLAWESGATPVLVLTKADVPGYTSAPHTADDDNHEGACQVDELRVGRMASIEQVVDAREPAHASAVPPPAARCGSQ